MDYEEISPFLALAIYIFCICAFAYRLFKSELRDHKLELVVLFIVSGIMANRTDISRTLQISLYIILMLMIIVFIFSVLKKDKTK